MERMTTSLETDAGQKAREAIYTDGITALRGAFSADWADRMRADIETAFAEAKARPGGAVGRGPHRYYVEIHPEQLSGFVDLVTHPWVRAVSAAVLQRPLLRRGSVRANAETGLRFKRIPRAERHARAARWLARFGLAPLADQPARSLSGGEAQRVSLARALALAPELLLLDEPFGALDAPTRAELLADLRDILAASSTAAILVTHDRHEAAAVADRVAILHAGTLRQLGPPRAVLAHPADADCARLLGFENVVGAKVASRLLGRDVPHSIAVRAADCRLGPEGGEGRLERVLPFGEHVRAVVALDGARVLVDVPEAAWPGTLAPGAAVAVAADASAVVVLV